MMSLCRKITIRGFDLRLVSRTIAWHRLTIGNPLNNITPLKMEDSEKQAHYIYYDIL